MSDHSTGKQLQSAIRSDGTLRLTLETVPTPEPDDPPATIEVDWPDGETTRVSGVVLGQRLVLER